MKCPECKVEIDHVIVYSPCSQRGTLNGNKIIDYDNTEVGSVTDEICCPECMIDISEFIEET